MVLIKNKSRMSFTLTLELHQDYGNELAPTKVVQAFPTQLPDGTPGVRHVDRAIPQSVTWEPGEEKLLADAVAAHPVVRARVLAGTMIVQDAPAPEPPPAPPSPGRSWSRRRSPNL